MEQQVKVYSFKIEYNVTMDEFDEIENPDAVVAFDYNEEEEYLIVGSQETNCLENKISNESPMGQALLGAKVGDTRIVKSPGGDIPYKVLEISIAD